MRVNESERMLINDIYIQRDAENKSTNDTLYGTTSVIVSLFITPLFTSIFFEISNFLSESGNFILHTSVTSFYNLDKCIKFRV